MDSATTLGQTVTRMDDTPQTTEATAAEGEGPKQRSLLALLRSNRVLLLCAILSALLHAAIYYGLNIREMFTAEHDIEFSRSVGIALLQRAGVVPPQGAAAPAPAKPEVAKPEPPAAEPEPPKPEEPKPEEPEPEEPEPEEPKPEEPKPEEPKEKTPQPAEPKPAEPKQERPVGPTASDGATAAAGEGSGYPEGTLHPIATDVGMWGPEGAILTAILRMDRIRASQHEKELRALFGSLPDWQALVGSGAFDPFRDVDALLIASADPRWVNQTFLAAVHRMPPERVVRTLTASIPGGVTWEQKEGRVIGHPFVPPRINDPRLFLIPTDGLFIFTRPEFMAPLLDGAPDPGLVKGAIERSKQPEGSGEGGTSLPRLPAKLTPPQLGGSKGATQPQLEIRDGSGLPPAAPALPATNAADEPPIGDSKPPIRADGWIAGLLEIADFGGAGELGPAVDLTARGFTRFRLPGLDRTPLPESAHLVVSADRDPVVNGRLVFKRPADADAFIAAWPRMLQVNQTALFLFGLSTPLEKATWRREESEAIFRLVIPRNLLVSLSQTIPALMESRKQP